MDEDVVVDIGNDIVGFVPVSQLNFGNPVNSPADIVWENMNIDVRVLEVDPIQRRIVLAVTNIPEGQDRPAEPSKVIPMQEDTLVLKTVGFSCQNRHHEKWMSGFRSYWCNGYGTTNGHHNERTDPNLAPACLHGSEYACGSESPVEPQPAPELPGIPIIGVRVTSSADIAFVGSITSMTAAVSADPGTRYTLKWSLPAGTITATIDSATGAVTALAPGSASATACAAASLPNGRSQTICGEATIGIIAQFAGVAARGLAFVRNGTVFLSGPDGSEPAALVTGATKPAWSPDGARVAFTRTDGNRLARWQVCTGNSDGSDIRCATGAADGRVTGTPSWSPDGKMVAFSVFTYQCPNGQCGQYGGYFSSVLVLNTATMDVEALNTPPVISVAWSPDGRKIALVLAHVGTFGRGALGTVRPDGSGLQILAMSLGSYSAEAVTWSADSRMLALVLSDENACPWYCDTAIAVVSADATNLKLLDRARTLVVCN